MAKEASTSVDEKQLGISNKASPNASPQKLPNGNFPAPWQHWSDVVKPQIFFKALPPSYEENLIFYCLTN